MVRPAEEDTRSEELNILSHPNIGQLYRRKVEELESVLTGPDTTQAIDLLCFVQKCPGKS